MIAQDQLKSIVERIERLEGEKANLADDIRPWSATGYTFFKRQAQDDPNVWLSLGGAIGAAPAAAASE